MDDLIIRAAIIDELSAPLERILTDVSAFAREVDKASRAALRASASTTKLGASGSTAGAAARAHAERLATVRRRADEMNASFLRVVARGGAQLLHFAKRGAQAFGIMATAVAAFGVKSALSLQSSRAAFANFTTDPDGLIRQLRGLDATKALGLGQTAQTASRLGAFGIKAQDLPSTVASLTDVAFLQGSEGAAQRLNQISLALGQVQTKGRIMAEEAVQFTEAGAPIYERLAEAMGIGRQELAKMLSDPQDSAKIFNRIGGGAGLARILGEGNAKGAAARASRSTLIGNLTSVKNRFGGAVAAGSQGTLDRLSKLIFANESGLTSLENRIEATVSSGLPKLVDAVLGFWGRNGRMIRREVRLLIADVRDFARVVGPVLGDWLAVAIPLLLGMAHAVGFVSRALKPVSGLIFPVVAGLAAFQSVIAGSRAIAAMGAAVKGITSFAAAMRVLGLSAYANPYVLIAAAIIGVGVALYIAYRRSERFRNIVNAIGRFGKAAFGGMVEGIKTFIGWVRQAIDWLANLYDRIPGPIKRVLNFIVPGAAGIDAASSLPPPGGPSRPGVGATAARPSPNRNGATVAPVTVASHNMFVDGLQRREVERIAGEEAGKAYDSRDRAKKER